MTWEAIENALVSRIRAVTGLADGHVILTEQDGPRPQRPLIEITIGGCTPIGGPDEKRTVYDAGGDAGQELVRTITGEREFPVQLQAYSADTTKDTTARTLLDLVVLGLSQAATIEAYGAAGFSVAVPGDVLPLPAIFKTKHESRASLSLRCYTRLELVERLGYVEHATAVLNAAHTIVLG